MLGQWLAPGSVAQFLDEHLQRTPWARPGATRAAIARFDGSTLDRVLRAAPAADVLVVARGRLLPIPPPRDRAALRGLMAMGVGLVIHHGERHEPGLAEVARGFEADLPGEVHVQLFVTPGGTHGFGWHYDAEDVFIGRPPG